MRVSRRDAIAIFVLAIVSHLAAAQSGYVTQTLGNPPAVNVSFGTIIAVVGDVDGDGRDDYLVGDPQAQALNIYTSGGEVRLVSGATGTTIRSHQGNSSLGGIGNVIAGVGDLDADGVPDYAIGSPYYGGVQAWGGYPPAYLSAPGRVTVWSGATGAQLFTVTGGTTQVPGTGYGGSAGTYGDNLGWSICGPGDVTGDGIPDLVIGAPAASTPTQIGRGQFLVRSGATGAITKFTGTSAGESLGARVVAAGDLNGDGIPDVIVTAPGVGAVRAYTGVSWTLLWTAVGPPGSSFPGVIASAGDVNGDGTNDLIVGAPYDTPPGQNFPSPPGRAFVLSGKTGLQLCALNGTFSGEQFGGQVARAGDINGDGYADVLVSSPNFGFPNTGRVQLFLGPTCTTGQVVAVATLPSDQLGTGLAGGAHLDGDAVPDILIGAPEYPGLGRVQALSGATLGPLYQIHGTPAPFGIGQFTGAVDAGDQDGDGKPDFALGNRGTIALVSGVTGQLIRLLPGPSPNAYTQLTYPIACLGDIDGDGYRDFAAATTPWPNSVQLNVVSGFSGVNLYAHTWAGCFSSVNMISCPDVDGDGIRDLVIGLPVASTCTPSDIGRVELRSGATGALLAQRFSTVPLDGFASSIDMVGDLDGDGVSDLVVGVPQTQAGIPGSVVALSGATLAPLFTVTGTFTGLGGYLYGLGIAVAGIGDVNGDGIPDFAATDWPATGLPVVRLYSGAGGASIGAITSPPLPVSGFGLALAGVGDVNGDGIPDVAIGAQWTGYAPSAPNSSGEVFVYSGAGGAPLFTVSGTYENEGFGAVLSVLGDRNGDGLADVFAGAGPSSHEHAEILSFAGIPHGSHEIGAPCVLASGRTPSLAAFGGDPTSGVGNPAFGLIVSNGNAGCPGAIAAGSSTSVWGGVSLPLGLGPLAPGCSLYVSVDVLATFVLSGPLGGPGAIRFPIPVPAAPNLAGTTVNLQAYVADSPSSAFPGAVTRGLTIVVQ